MARNPDNPLHAGFPNSPVLEESGYLTGVWHQFFMALYTRTGSSVGVAAGPDLTQELHTETAERVSGDATLTTQIAAETTARSSADATLSAAIASESAARLAADQVLAAGGTLDLNAALKIVLGAGPAASRPVTLTLLPGLLGFWLATDTGVLSEWNGSVWLQGTHADGATASPDWTSGSGAPAAVKPVGSLYSNTAGGIGTKLYVSQGGGTWLPIVGV